MGEEQKDKRGYPRARLHTSCDLEIDGRYYAGGVLDVSAAGASVRLEAELPRGREVDIRLTDFGTPPMWLRARVVRSLEEGGVGVEIVSAPEEFYSMLYALML